MAGDWQLARSRASSKPNEVAIWETEDGRGLRVLRGLPTVIGNLTISPDGRRSAAISQDWHIAVWDHAAGRMIGLFDGPRASFVEAPASPSAPTAAASPYPPVTRRPVRDLDSGRLIRSWTLPEALSEVLWYQGPDRLLLARQETSDLKIPPFTSADPPLPSRGPDRNLFGPDPARPLAEITEINLWICGLTGSPDGSCLVVEGLAGQPGRVGHLVRAYDWTTGKQLLGAPTTLPANDTSSADVAFDPAGSVVGFVPDPNPGPLRRLFLAMPGRTPIGWVDGTYVGPWAERLVDIRGGTPESLVRSYCSSAGTRSHFFGSRWSQVLARPSAAASSAATAVSWSGATGTAASQPATCRPSSAGWLGSVWGGERRSSGVTPSDNQVI